MEYTCILLCLSLMSILRCLHIFLTRHSRLHFLFVCTCVTLRTMFELSVGGRFDMKLDLYICMYFCKTNVNSENLKIFNF